MSQNDHFWTIFGSILGPFWDHIAPFGLQKGSAKNASKKVEFGVVLLRITAVARRGTVAALRGPARGGGILTEFPCGLRKWSNTPQPVKDWRGGSKSAARKAATVPFFVVFFRPFLCLLGSVGRLGACLGHPMGRPGLRSAFGMIFGTLFGDPGEALGDHGWDQEAPRWPADASP